MELNLIDTKAAEPHLFMRPYGYKCLGCMSKIQALGRSRFTVIYDRLTGVRH